MSVYWIDIIDEIVTSVRNDADKPATLASDEPFFMHGHPKEIIDLLGQKDKHDTQKFNKYPLIALFQDFPEQMGQDMSIKSSADLNVLFIMQTSLDYTSAERYTNSFRPTLYPLYDLFIKHVNDSGFFTNVTYGLVPHDKIDRLFWGRSGLYGNEGNIFNDRIDAIEIQNLHLELRLVQKCKIN